MNFEPGESYWVLTENEYKLMLEYLSELTVDEQFENQLATDFVQVGENYYASLNALNNDEYTFLEDNGLLNPFAYKKSVQSTQPV